MRPTDRPDMTWNLVDLAAYRADAPLFYLGVRFGDGEGHTEFTYRNEPIPTMQRRSFARPHMLETLWGSRNPTERWLGDQAFDYHFHGPEKAPRLLLDGSWRARGQPGLLLFHPIEEPSGFPPSIAIGLALPKGGPDQIAALRARDANKT